MATRPQPMALKTLLFYRFGLSLFCVGYAIHNAVGCVGLVKPLLRDRNGPALHLAKTAYSAQKLIVVAVSPV